MSDQHRFTRDLMWLRRSQPALRADGLNVCHVHNDNRVIAFHRWVPGASRDVVVVASLNEDTFYDRSYRIGFPAGGRWQEVFNSDLYDDFVNPRVQVQRRRRVRRWPGVGWPADISRHHAAGEQPAGLRAGVTAALKGRATFSP